MIGDKCIEKSVIKNIYIRWKLTCDCGNFSKGNNSVPTLCFKTEMCFKNVGPSGCL